MTKWWPLTASKEKVRIEWCADCKDNVRVKKADKWIVYKGYGVKAKHAFVIASKLLKKAR